MVEDGDFTWPKPFWEQPLWRWDAMFSAGVRAHYHASQLAARTMVAKRRGLEIKSQYPQFAKEIAKVVVKMSGPEAFGLMMEAGVAEAEISALRTSGVIR